MGKASTPYARSVQQMNSISLDTLPDPGLVFDTLLKRRQVRCFHHRLNACRSSLMGNILVPGSPGWVFRFDVLVGCARHS
jgi:hypothetical protein